MTERAAEVKGRVPLIPPTLMCGPLHRLAGRLDLVDSWAEGTLPFGLALAGLMWGVMIVLATVEGSLARLLSLDMIAGHVRILVATPLLFAAESLLEPHFARFVNGLHRSGMARGDSAAALGRAGVRFNRFARSRVAEAAMLMIATLPGWNIIDLPSLGVSALQHDAADVRMGWAASWYWFVCLSVFRFLLLRWLWRLGLYYLFLWRVSRLKLRMVPTHPDRMAGLGYLFVMQTALAVLVTAISTVMSASVAEEIAATGASLEHFYGTILLVVIACLGLFALPLLMFTKLLRVARAKGMATYMELASAYVNAFDDKWVGHEPEPADLLGSADIQSLADIGNAARVVDEMRFTPISVELLLRLGLWAVIPFLPLKLLELPLDEVAKRMLERLIGG